MKFSNCLEQGGFRISNPEVRLNFQIGACRPRLTQPMGTNYHIWKVILCHSDDTLMLHAFSFNLLFNLCPPSICKIIFSTVFTQGNLWMLQWSLVSFGNLCFNCTKSYSCQPGPPIYLQLPMYPPCSHSQNHSPQVDFYIYGWNDFLPDPRRCHHRRCWHRCLPQLPH